VEPAGSVSSSDEHPAISFNMPKNRTLMRTPSVYRHRCGARGPF
jgi:hypothetical protein